MPGQERQLNENARDLVWELGERYDEAYFATGLGEPYNRDNPSWAAFFERVADFIVAEFSPRTVLDAGCAIGFLVEALRERGVDARGFDVSEYAISQLPDELKPYCVLGSVTDEIDGSYDLITCIEVLEHVRPEEAERALDNLTRHTDRILFSSTPDDEREPTHVNVKPPHAWVADFAERGFLPRAIPEALALSPQAIVFERRQPLSIEDIGAYESIRYRLARDLVDLTATHDAALADAAEVEQQLKAAKRERHELVARSRAAEAKAKRERHELVARSRAAEAKAKRERHELVARSRAAEATAADLGERLEELRATTWWRIGRPLRRAVTVVRVRGDGSVRGLGGAPSGPAGLVRLAKPLVPLRARRALRERFSVAQPKLAPPEPLTVAEVVETRFPLLRPLSIFPVPRDGRRHLTVITDSLSAGSLFGGVGTSMILAAMLARRLDASLRVITRTQRPDPANFGTVLRTHAIDWDRNVEFAYSPLDANGSGFPYRDGEIVLTTSWWSTWAALRAVDPSKIVYLLQEDERLFYPAGDEQVTCSEVLADDRIRFVVNTAMLRDYLVDEGFANVRDNGLAFEPAFPESIYFHQPRAQDGRKRFFFYARPDNVRNLFLRGFEAVTEAVAQGILPPDEWELHFVGSRVPPVRLPRDVRPTISENLPWPEYAALIRSVDVGLSLMATPHPSYPPLDLAACGAIAVTNRFGPKQNLDRYSRNIVCAELSRETMVEALAEAVELAADEPRRLRNYREQRLSRSWETSFGPVIDALTSTL